MGNGSSRPRSETRVSSRDTSTRTRGRRRMRSKAARFSRSVISSPAPPATYSKARCEMRPWASDSKSPRLTGGGSGPDGADVGGPSGSGDRRGPAKPAAARPRVETSASRRVVRTGPSVMGAAGLPGLRGLSRELVVDELDEVGGLHEALAESVVLGQHVRLLHLGEGLPLLPRRLDEPDAVPEHVRELLDLGLPREGAMPGDDLDVVGQGGHRLL